MPFSIIFHALTSNTVILSSSIPPTSLSKQVHRSTTSLFYLNSFSSSSSPYDSILLLLPPSSSFLFSLSHSIVSSQHNTHSGGSLPFSLKFPILHSHSHSGFFSFFSSSSSSPSFFSGSSSECTNGITPPEAIVTLPRSAFSSSSLRTAN